jgi:SAM-dependent methyltransferase
MNAVRDWEAVWAPYDSDTYAAALHFLRPDDVVLDIGAGDLRFARLAASRVERVIAVERNPDLLFGAPMSADFRRHPRVAASNVDVVCADALTVPFPPGITAGVLLMRHCHHFREYAAKLRAVGCRRLVTNARWGMNVEAVRLDTPCVPHCTLRSAWYACECGAVGFAPGPAELLNGESLDNVIEVEQCPKCRYQ